MIDIPPKDILYDKDKDNIRKGKDKDNSHKYWDKYQHPSNSVYLKLADKSMKTCRMLRFGKTTSHLICKRHTLNRKVSWQR